MWRGIVAVLLLVAGGTSMAEERWATAVAKNGERQIVFRYVVGFANGFDRATQPDRIIIQWKYQSESGMPSLQSDNGWNSSKTCSRQK